ncbi:uncharacterized protein BCR38DRAFT_429458 [Pseudomassariella vexata]|uniref:Uncharacterized protein n=1 Tax=Pseudomassariella vexata TaxID=1141098 RepID=A0A1Y2E3N4_9PEZI|nr:uncharacterized protein BCR38DRAFT_429458 [Pseudomassariella vexata]ORY66161.1 hypothetical protein BCR38DRAFT_429458 [Pseudomassariella vexata]
MKTGTTINQYWDRISKVLILLVDAGLNWYFLRIVQKRLLEQHGLTKYAPLVSFNAKLMVLSVAMDAMLVGLMSLPNEVVYIQFHPVAYMVKLNIEMSMASLITRLAQGKNSDAHFNSLSYSTRNRNCHNQKYDPTERAVGLRSFTKSRAQATSDGEAEPGHGTGINRRFDVEVTVHHDEPSERHPSKGHGNHVVEFTELEDEMSLTYNPGPPRTTAYK